MRELIIGIDGGGTKTNLVAVDIQTGLIAATSTVGSIHISTQGEAAALRHLELGIAELGLGSADRVAAVSIGDPAIDDCDGDTPDSVLAASAAALCRCPKVFVKSDVCLFRGSAWSVFDFRYRFHGNCVNQCLSSRRHQSPTNGGGLGGTHGGSRKRI